MHTDEAYFRDTAHGLMVWAVGAVVSALVLSSAASSVSSGLGRAGAAAVQAVGPAAAGPASRVAGQAVSSMGDPTAYFTDMLFRTDHPAASGDKAATTAEIGRIFARALSSGDLPAADKTYVAQVVASRTGLGQADAEKTRDRRFRSSQARRRAAADKAKAAADAARKTGIYVSLWAFASLLVGAFAASYTATVGGRTRDEETISD